MPAATPSWDIPAKSGVAGNALLRATHRAVMLAMVPPEQNAPNAWLALCKYVS